jgi:hypothetical protein
MHPSLSKSKCIFIKRFSTKILYIFLIFLLVIVACVINHSIFNFTIVIRGLLGDLKKLRKDFLYNTLNSRVIPHFLGPNTFIAMCFLKLINVNESKSACFVCKIITLYNMTLRALKVKEMTKFFELNYGNNFLDLRGGVIK